MSTPNEKVVADLIAAGAAPDILKTAQESIDKNLPKKTYTLAVKFLGWATLLLIAGAIASLLLNKSAAALWTAVGAGLGGLAGIFTGKNG